MTSHKAWLLLSKMILFLLDLQLKFNKEKNDLDLSLKIFKFESSIGQKRCRFCPIYRRFAEWICKKAEWAILTTRGFVHITDFSDGNLNWPVESFFKPSILLDLFPLPHFLALAPLDLSIECKNHKTYMRKYLFLFLWYIIFLNFIFIKYFS